MREIACEYCGNGQKAREMEVHLDRCLDYPIPCPNNCNKKIPRNSVNAHLSVDCLLQMVKCPYREYGCEDTVAYRGRAGGRGGRPAPGGILTLTGLKIHSIVSI